MNLPDYFLVDLPPEASLSPDLVREACQTLRKNRETYLLHRDTASLIRTLSELGASWLDAQYPFRQKALQEGPAATGFSAPVLQDGLDSFFRQLNEANLRALVEQDLGHVDRLDRLVSSESERRSGIQAMATGPALMFHVTAGTLPIPALMSMVLGLLIRSSQFVKCASGAAFIPRLFGHSLYELDPKLGACLEIAQWRGGTASFENILLREADCVTATGSDETLQSLRRQVPPGVRFLAYGHRISFGFVCREELSPSAAKQWSSRAARDVAAWDQLGCLSPHVIYVEREGRITPEQWAEMLATELAGLEKTMPRGPAPLEVSAAIASRRAFYALRAAASPDTRSWQSEGSTAWTVVYEADPRFQLSCLHRFIYVKGVEHLEEALQGADEVRSKISTVGVAASAQRLPEIALRLAAWGAPRVCPLGQMQKPPLTWRHDGRPALGDLIGWTQLEM
ncbi:acyl-CoA reductase [Fontisphaera persica]|uniref:acyl-CoA reductase n=1 Tax=Fontisphaera persica TaxID=2974023 RepID=UPI0024C08BB1|nr:acyl-CoA reductase [Fontisphaera persica]WCJ60461.1 acyl-CoA reductase [Fontisphaera persica]